MFEISLMGNNLQVEGSDGSYSGVLVEKNGSGYKFLGGNELGVSVYDGQYDAVNFTDTEGALWHVIEHPVGLHVAIPSRLVKSKRFK